MQEDPVSPFDWRVVVLRVDVGIPIDRCNALQFPSSAYHRGIGINEGLNRLGVQFMLKDHQTWTLRTVKPLCHGSVDRLERGPSTHDRPIDRAKNGHSQ